MQRLSVAYLLESTVLCGGVKVVLRQAEALRKRGHLVTVISNDQSPQWFEGVLDYQRHDPLDPSLGRQFDRLICTSPRFVPVHYEVRQNSASLWQLVQGYEGDFSDCRDMLPEIQAAYSLSVPALTISQRLASRLEKLFPQRGFFSVGQGLENEYFYSPEVIKSDNNIESLIMVGPLTISLKQIKMGLEAYTIARKKYPNLRLIRISSVDTRTEEEEIVGSISEYHVHVRPIEVGAIFRGSRGMLLFPSGPEEGFGLPPLEAMACGLPAVLSNIPSLTSYDRPVDYAMFVRHDSVQDMAMGICRLIADKNLCRFLISRGLEVASGFSYEKVAMKIEQTLINE